MEDIVGAVLVIIAFAISAISKQKKRQKAAMAERQAFESQSIEPKETTYKTQLYAETSKPAEKDAPAALKAAAPAAAAKVVPNETYINHQDGSVVTAPAADHRHEGKEAPCPAAEREMPRRRPSQQNEQQASVPKIPGLQLSFDRNTVLQGVVMSEILNRPRPGVRR